MAFYQNPNKYPIFIQNPDGSYKDTLWERGWFEDDHPFFDEMLDRTPPILIKVEKKEDLLPEVKKPQPHKLVYPHKVREEDLLVMPIKKLVKKANSLGVKCTIEDHRENIIGRLLRRA